MRASANSSALNVHILRTPNEIFYLSMFSTTDSVSPFFFSSSPPSFPIPSFFSPCEPLAVSPSVKEVSSVAALTWGDCSVGSGATPFWVSSSTAEALGADGEAAWPPSFSLPEALGEAGLVCEEGGEGLTSLGWLGVSFEAFWCAEEEVGASDLRLVFASFPSACVEVLASLDARERGVVAEAPVFFGW